MVEKRSWPAVSQISSLSTQKQHHQRVSITKGASQQKPNSSKKTILLADRLVHTNHATVEVDAHGRGVVREEEVLGEACEERGFPYTGIANDEDFEGVIRRGALIHRDIITREIRPDIECA